MAQAFPNSTFVGSDYHAGLDRDGARAGRRRPASATACASSTRRPPSYPGHGLRPRHDVRLPARHGRSGRRGTPRPRDARRRRHLDDRRADGRRPRRGQPQPGRPRVLRLLDVPVHARRRCRRRSGWRSAPRRARRGSATWSPAGGFTASAARPRRPSTWCSKPGRDDYDRPGGPERHRDPGAAARRAGHRRARRRPDPLGALRRRRARRSCSCPPGRSCTRACGRARSPTSRATSASITFDGARQRALGPADRAGGLRRTRVRRRRRRRARRGGRRRGRRSSGSRWAALRALLLAAAHPERALGACLIVARRSRSLVPPDSGATRSRSTTSSRPTRAGRSTTATTGCATTAGSSSSSSARCSPSRTRRSRSRTASPGAWTRRRRR